MCVDSIWVNDSLIFFKAKLLPVTSDLFWFEDKFLVFPFFSLLADYSLNVRQLF
jgi:hypothetical protein